MTPTPAQEAMMRKVAFRVGFARYLHQHGDHRTAAVLSGKLEKTAGDAVEKLMSVALLGVPVLSYFGGRHLGRLAGNVYGNSITPSKAAVSEREYRLASAATQRMIDDMNAERTNKEITEALDEEDPARKAPPPRPFATPSLLRYGR
jgi:hypothetical protein